MSFELSKREIRALSLKLRSELSSSKKRQYSKRIVNRLLSSKFLLKSKAISLYFPYQNEVDLRYAFFKLWKRKYSISLPIVSGESLFFSKITRESAYCSNDFGILEPISLEVLSSYLLSVIVLPLVAFDENGTRLGFGKGYYDKFLGHLSGKKIVVGVAFECQKVAFIPKEPHDYPLQFCITEKKIYKF